MASVAKPLAQDEEQPSMLKEHSDDNSDGAVPPTSIAAFRAGGGRGPFLAIALLFFAGLAACCIFLKRQQVPLSKDGRNEFIEAVLDNDTAVVTEFTEHYQDFSKDLHDQARQKTTQYNQAVVGADVRTLTGSDEEASCVYDRDLGDASNDLQDLGWQTVDACWRACVDNPDCDFWVQIGANGWRTNGCWLKRFTGQNAFPDVTQNELIGATGGVRSCGKACPKGYRQLGNLGDDVPGWGLSSHGNQAADMNDCAAQCDAIADCGSFEWNLAVPRGCALNSHADSVTGAQTGTWDQALTCKKV
jgi:hypothetical protein